MAWTLENDVYTVVFSELNDLLQSLPANTVETPYKLNITELTASDIGNSSTSGTLGYVIKNNSTKFVDLSSTNIPNSVTNMFYCFSSCTSLTTAPNIPNSVFYMEDCFRDCTSLTTVPNIPNSVLYMTRCFLRCTSLETIESWELTDLTNVGMTDCFSNCTSLREIKVSTPIVVEDTEYKLWKIQTNATTNIAKVTVYNADGTVKLSETQVPYSANANLTITGKTDELGFAPVGSLTNELIEKMLSYKTQITGDTNRLNPDKKNFAMYAENPANFHSNIIFPNGIEATCTTVGSSQEKEITLNWEGDKLYNYSELYVKFTYSNTSNNPDLKVYNIENELIGTYDIVDSNGNPITGSFCDNNAVVVFKIIDSQVRIMNCSSSGGAVESVNGQTGEVVLSASDVGATPKTSSNGFSPGALSFKTTNTTINGYVGIKFDTSIWSNSMLSFKVRVTEYEPNTVTEFLVRAYPYYDTNRWYSADVVLVATNGSANWHCWFGADDSGNGVILIAKQDGESNFSYPQVDVYDFSGGYTGVNYDFIAHGQVMVANLGVIGWSRQDVNKDVTISNDVTSALQTAKDYTDSNVTSALQTAKDYTDSKTNIGIKVFSFYDSMTQAQWESMYDTLKQYVQDNASSVSSGSVYELICTGSFYAQSSSYTFLSISTVRLDKGFNDTLRLKFYGASFGSGEIIIERTKTNNIMKEALIICRAVTS